MHELQPRGGAERKRGRRAHTREFLPVFSRTRNRTVTERLAQLPHGSWTFWTPLRAPTPGRIIGLTEGDEMPGKVRLRPDGSVVIPGDVAGEVLRALVRDLTARVRADGGEVSPSVRRVLYALHDATQRAEQPEPGSDNGTPAVLPATVELTAHQAALLLECSPEYARRLARSGRVHARRAGPAWLIDSASLDAYRKGRAA